MIFPCSVVFIQIQAQLTPNGDKENAARPSAISSHQSHKLLSAALPCHSGIKLRSSLRWVRSSLSLITFVSFKKEKYDSTVNGFLLKLDKWQQLPHRTFTRSITDPGVVRKHLPCQNNPRSAYCRMCLDHSEVLLRLLNTSQCCCAT